MRTQLILLGTATLLGINGGSIYSNQNNPELWRSTNFGIKLGKLLTVDSAHAAGIFGNMVEEE